MQCAQWTILATEGGDIQVLTPVQPPPVDLSTCVAVMLDGNDVGSVSFFELPTPADASTAWVWGFSLVVGSYAFAWGAGAVLNFLKKD